MPPDGQSWRKAELTQLYRLASCDLPLKTLSQLVWRSPDAITAALNTPEAKQRLFQLRIHIAQAEKL